jgi:hypothetical protein
MCLVVQQMQAIKSKIALLSLCLSLSLSLSLSLYLVCMCARAHVCVCVCVCVFVCEKLSRTVVAMGLATASFSDGQHDGGSKPAGDRYHACISNMDAGTWSRESDSASLTLLLSPSWLRESLCLRTNACRRLKMFQISRDPYCPKNHHNL